MIKVCLKLCQCFLEIKCCDSVFLFKRCSSFFHLLCHQALLERTGYTLDVTTGQRKYGGPPPGSTHAGVQPTVGTEVSAVENTHLSTLVSIFSLRVLFAL